MPGPEAHRAKHLREERDRVLRQIEVLRWGSSNNYLPGMGAPDNRKLISDLTIVADALNRELAEMDDDD
jgi:hypothetical protein